MTGTPPDAEPADARISASDGRSYWQSISADVNGMLGGYSHISHTDLEGSRAFLAKLGIGTKTGLRTVSRALEGGAGIGRITQGLLLDVAEEMDVVEPIAKFTASLSAHPGVASVSNIGLEEWQPEPDVVYDLVWNQWCLGHLTDGQLVAYLRRCKAALRPGGEAFIVVKENLSTSGRDLFDDVDSSVTRCVAWFGEASFFPFFLFFSGGREREKLTPACEHTVQDR
ncbi:DUF858-domain-containing protein [Sodiomyces alkalinus F11]|uniref:Alpha N-terminal protein methyltransferase 1 n=1 Tax=Sodiomyces alkalinus (strain CBS 110278 / VKM F-3762 / F11) TaxID=1314773 RepID=A0A3N2PNB9_SODAK|nr:DUF858-domain-containing protein [Sodiomyces alkalinus F11]ROT36027.1 DUF858-domain-containing protein [Sodiomyces alkalinus F11]